MKKTLPILLAGAALMSAAVVARRYRKAIRAAQDRLANLNSQVIETACGPVEYAQTGEGAPILVVHGAFGGFDQGLWVAKSMGLTHYRVISVSRFGFLRTPLPPGADLNRQADAFAALLDALGIQRVVVFGLSAGSTASIRFAARHPERVTALILVGPDAPGEGYMTMPPRFFFDKVFRSDFLYWAFIALFPEKVQNGIGLAPKGHPLTPEQAAFLKKNMLGTLPISRRMDGEIFESYDLLPELFESVQATSPYPLNQIHTPTLVISAADDPISLLKNVRAMAEQMPNARLCVIPEGGHFFFGHDQEVKALIEAFLREQVGEPHEASTLDYGTNLL